jgi:hypothetical protein
LSLLSLDYFFTIFNGALGELGVVVDLKNEEPCLVGLITYLLSAKL